MAKTAGGVLNTVDRVHKLTGTPFMETVTEAAHKGDARSRAAVEPGHAHRFARLKAEAGRPAGQSLPVVYFPSCASRAMGGPAREETERQPPAAANPRRC